MSTTTQVIAGVFKNYYGQLSGFLALKYGVGSDAEDIAQEAFQNMLRVSGASKIDDPKAYLYRAASNIALNHLRRQGYREDYLASLIDYSEEGAEMEVAAIAFEEVETVQVVVNSLSEKDRQTFLMNRIDGKSYSEISDELGVTVSTVEKRMMKVLAKLRNAVGR